MPDGEGLSCAASGAVVADRGVARTAADFPWLPICVFVLISAADTISTLVLLQAGLMTEFNPLMNFVLRHYGLTGFALVKLLLILIPASIFCRVARQRPGFVRRVIWVLNGAYVALYVVLFWSVNTWPPAA